MDVATLSAAAVTYLISTLKKSKGFEKASEELSTAIWDWVRPIFLKDEEPLKDFENEPEIELNQKEIEVKIQKHISQNEPAKLELEEIIKMFQSKGEQAQIVVNQVHHGSGDNIGRDKYGK